MGSNIGSLRLFDSLYPICVQFASYLWLHLADGICKGCEWKQMLKILGNLDIIITF